MIKALTPRQEEQLATFRREWYEWGICTLPADRGKAEGAIMEMRKEIGHSKAPVFVWVDSPMTAQMAIHYLKSREFKGMREKELGSSLESSLRSSLKSSLESSLWSSLRSSGVEYISTSFWGQMDAYWIAYYLFCRDVLGVKYDAEKSRHLDLWRDVTQSCGWWWCYENYVIICERPAVVNMEPHDGAERLHCEDGPAVVFRDGWSVYAIHGIVVPENLIMDPGSITVEQIEGEQNRDIRDWMLANCRDEVAVIGALALAGTTR